MPRNVALKTGVPTDMSSYLRRHEIVFLSPPYHGWEGLPLGNGTMGGPVWFDERGLRFQLNHTDTWEKGIQGDKTQNPTMFLRSCGQLFIRHAAPAYAWLFSRHFEARLSLHRAEMIVENHSEFGLFKTKSFVHAKTPVCVFDHSAAYEGTLSETGAPLRISFERWGTPVFRGWYVELDKQVGADRGRTESGMDGRTVWITQVRNGVTFTVAMRVQGIEATARVIHGHSVEFEIAPSPVQKFRLLVACVTNHDSNDPRADAIVCLDDFEKSPPSRVNATHRRWWKAFWNKSFLHISNDYYENLYYLYLYLMGSSSRGKFPPVFNGALWTWNHDVRNWGDTVVHWNQQQLTWPLPAANRLELMKPFMDTYLRLTKTMSRQAKDRGMDGIFLPEGHSFSTASPRRGADTQVRSASYNDYSFTAAAQIALQFFWYYQYSGDIEYLREKAFPFMDQAADFYLSALEWDPQEEVFFLPASCTYEMGSKRFKLFKNAVTDLAMIRALFDACIKAGEILELDCEKKNRLHSVLAHLAPFVLNDRNTEHGVTVASGIVRKTNDLPEEEDNLFGLLHAPVFPAGLVGLADRSSRMFTAEINTLHHLPPVMHADSITPLVLIAARLGQVNVAIKRLSSMVRNIQHFPNGLFFNQGHWTQYSRRTGKREEIQRDYLYDRACRYQNVKVKNSKGIVTHVMDTPMPPFIQPGFESMANFAAGLQEMLFQSYDRVLRVFPAYPGSWEGAFLLRGVGGFMVYSRKRQNRNPDFVGIRSLLGNACSIHNPWKSKPLLLDEQRKELDYRMKKKTITFSTEKGRTYFLCIRRKHIEYAVFPEIRNNAPKEYQEARIGLDM